jgi:hypothetical protein
MKKNSTSIIICAAGMVLAGVMVGMSGVPSQEAGAFTKSTLVVPGIGTTYGYAKYTNSTGSTTITPSNGVTSITFSDISSFPTNYQSVVLGQDTLTQKMYGTNPLANTITIPVSTNAVTGNDPYKLTVYVLNTPPPPSNGVPILMSLIQNTN